MDAPPYNGALGVTSNPGFSNSAAGTTWTDPIYKVSIMKVTDGSFTAASAGGTTPANGSGYGCKNEYSYWPTFNYDSTLAFFTCTYVLNGSNQNDTVLISFDPVKFALNNWGTTTSKFTKVTLPFNTEDAIWSSVSTTPRLIYGHTATQLLSYDAGSGVTTTIVDFSTLSQTKGYTVQQMSKDGNDDKFAFTLVNSAGANYGYVVYSKGQNKIWTNAITADEFHIDKSGLYLSANAVSGVTNTEDRVYEMSTGHYLNLTDGAPDYDFDHADYASGMVAGYEDWSPSTTLRFLSSPHKFTTILPAFPLGTGTDWSQTVHISTLADNEAWTLQSLFVSNTNPSSGIMQNEIVLIANDGSQRVARLANHRSVYTSSDYWSEPRADISRDGRLIAFTSNWGVAQGRLDVYFVQVPVGNLGSLAVYNKSLPDATTGNQSETHLYYTRLGAFGGTPPYTYSATGLPQGLSCDAATGVISGTPSASAGSYTVTAQVTDSTSAAASAALTLNVHNALTLTTTSLAAATAGVNYSQTISTAGGATGGMSAYTFAITSGSLPTGLKLTTNSDGTATISGKTNSAGTYSFTIQASDGEYSAASQQYSLTVARRH